VAGVALEWAPASSVDVMTATASLGHDSRLGLGIREVAECTGLSVDTLRWYEREGLLPSVPRAGGGRRIYSEQMLAFVRLVVALRRTGMSVADTRAFVGLASEGAASHGRRLALLENQREQIVVRRRQLDEDLSAVEHKISHYQDLIDRGLDCDGVPVDATTARVQRRSS
jgi:DNA-binding transcriptional MerR regulator